MFKSIIALTLLSLAVTTQASGSVQSSLYQFQLKMAQKGNTDAEFLVGQMNEEGRGTPKNIDQAIVWYKKAAASGNSEASKRLSELSNKKP